MTEHELAARDKLATQVMGWHEGYRANDYWWYDSNDHPVMPVRDWDPATNLDQAMQAAEKVAQEKRAVWHMQYWPYPIYEPNPLYHVDLAGVSVTTKSAADALARAVLKAAGGEA